MGTMKVCLQYYSRPSASTLVVLADHVVMGPSQLLHLMLQGTSGWRWTGEMEIPGVLYEGDFRKSSQWVALRRDHAKLVARDKKVYEKFKEHCFLDTRWWSAH